MRDTLSTGTVVAKEVRFDFLGLARLLYREATSMPNDRSPERIFESRSAGGFFPLAD